MEIETPYADTMEVTESFMAVPPVDNILIREVPASVFQEFLVHQNVKPHLDSEDVKVNYSFTNVNGQTGAITMSALHNALYKFSQCINTLFSLLEAEVTS